MSRSSKFLTVFCLVCLSATFLAAESRSEDIALGYCIFAPGDSSYKRIFTTEGVDLPGMYQHDECMDQCDGWFNELQLLDYDAGGNGWLDIQGDFCEWQFIHNWSSNSAPDYGEREYPPEIYDAFENQPEVH